MNILVNTRLLLHGKLEGIGWFTHELLRRIVKLHPEHTFYFLFDRPFHEQFIYAKNVKPLVYGPPARHPVLYWIWFEKIIPRVVKKYHINLFFSPDHYLSLNVKIPTLLAVHDLNFLHHPENLPKLEALYYKKFVTRYIQKATRLIAVSEHTKTDCIKTLNIEPDKIDIVYNAPNLPKIILNEEEKRQVRKKYTGGCPYFVYIGSLHRRKNIGRMLQAFDAFVEQTKADVFFVFVGKPMWKDKQLDHIYQQIKHKERIIFTGYLDSNEAAQILASALALVFVSLFEGFGVPVVEAMNMGVPVITSNISSMPEVAGNAAWLVNPFSQEEIQQAMKRLYEDVTLRLEMVKRGYQQASKYSWDISAQQLWKAIEKTITEQN